MNELGSSMALDKPHAFTGRANELLEALRRAGDWMSRADLARATNKNRLSPHDIGLLQRLVDAGLVDIRQRVSNTPVGKAYDYRAK